MQDNEEVTHCSRIREECQRQVCYTNFVYVLLRSELKKSGFVKRRKLAKAKIC